MGNILEHVRGIVNEIDSEAVDEMLKRISAAERVFVIGAGRSGLVGRGFAMRLMHCGKRVHVIGEVTTPPLKKGDVMVIISGSGETVYITEAARVAKEKGVYVISITSNKNSSLGKLADLVIVVKGRTKVDLRKDWVTRQIMGERQPLGPLGTLFEASAMVFLDGAIAEVMERCRVKEERMKERHADID
jgi:6-phospho-3-hexuloisomerase